jgi:beta-lactamase regulating signal transducer with metallopeptidase domain
VVLETQLALGGVGLAVVAALVGAAGASVHHDPRAAHAAVAFGLHVTYPEMNIAAGVLLALAAVGVVVVFRMVANLLGQVRSYREFLQDADVVGALEGYPDVTVISDSAPHAFCAGLRDPRVFISTGTIELLMAEELAAVVRHERDHRAARDPLRLAVIRALGNALFFMPALRPLAHRYGELAEVRADDAAVSAPGGDRRALASALLAFDENAAVDTAGAVGISPERVDALFGDPAPGRVPHALIAVSLATLVTLVVVAWRASAAAAANSTFNLPVVSSQPCVVVLALIPLFACLAARVAIQAARS